MNKFAFVITLALAASSAHADWPFSRLRKSWSEHKAIGCSGLLAMKILTMNPYRTLVKTVRPSGPSEEDERRKANAELVMLLMNRSRLKWLMENRDYLEKKRHEEIDARIVEGFEDLGSVDSQIAKTSEFLRTQGVPHEIHALPSRILTLAANNRLALKTGFHKIIRILPSKNDEYLGLLPAEAENLDWIDVALVFDPMERFDPTSDNVAAFVPDHRWVSISSHGLSTGLYADEPYKHEMNGHAFVDVAQRYRVEVPLFGSSSGNLPGDQNSSYAKFQSHDESRAQLVSFEHHVSSVIKHLERFKTLLTKPNGGQEEPVDNEMGKSFQFWYAPESRESRVDAAFIAGISNFMFPVESENDFYHAMYDSLHASGEQSRIEAQRTVKIMERLITVVENEIEDPSGKIYFFKEEEMIYAHLHVFDMEGTFQFQSKIPLLSVSEIPVFTQDKIEVFGRLKEYLLTVRERHQQLAHRLNKIEDRIDQAYDATDLETQSRLFSEIKKLVEPYTELPPLRSPQGKDIAWNGRHRSSLIASSDRVAARDKLLDAIVANQVPGLFEFVMDRAVHGLYRSFPLEVQKSLFIKGIQSEVNLLIDRLLSVNNWRNLSASETLRITLANTPSGISLLADFYRSKGLLRAKH